MLDATTMEFQTAGGRHSTQNILDATTMEFHKAGLWDIAPARLLLNVRLARLRVDLVRRLARSACRGFMLYFENNL